MILGLGLDLVEVERVRAAVERQGEAFIDRVLTPDEAAYCRFQAEPSIHIAARFAAKEAFSKAIGTGIGEGAGWKDIEVVRRDSGKPELLLHGKALESAESMGVIGMHLSITHTRLTAAAVVVLEGNLPATLT